jgi:flagellin-like protein
LYIMNRHFNNRGVSQIIAALLLIAIAVAAAILLYVFAIGLLGNLGSSGGAQTKEQLIMEAYNWSGNTITLTVRNVGSAAIDASHTDVFVNGISPLARHPVRPSAGDAGDEGRSGSKADGAPRRFSPGPTRAPLSLRLTVESSRTL